MRNNRLKKKMLVGGALAVLLLTGFSPNIVSNVKYSVNVNQKTSEQQAFLEQIKTEAKKGKMINSPFKIGESSSNISKLWGKPDTFNYKNMETDKPSPLMYDTFANGTYPTDLRSLIYSKKDVKFEVNSNKTIKSITSVDKRLNKLTKAQLTSFFGKPTQEFKDYALYKAGDYQLLFQFWHDGEFFNTNRYTLISKDSMESIKIIKQAAALAKQGKVVGVPFPIGTPIKEVIKKWGKPLDKNIPGSSYTYKNATFEVNLKTKKIIDILPYKSLEHVSFVTIKNTLGKPYKETIGQKVTERGLIYKFGKYKVNFYFQSEATSNSDLSFYSID